MARPYCDRCQTEVILDSDGRSCPNCGKVLMIPAPKPPPPPPRKPKPKARPQPGAPDRSAA